ncbi:hypothetical protein [Microvirga arsenatis]|uniref:Uncharacterized protein n=1 Tax=Microvirga arsenatis TaxID=2692265 RepID=A0ABW9Z463_9HYPH|nr:hypothetical protein [Microvirga arsenatis]NBJ13687.1 hypothetical protein [Microvirga arsenatis]NBJ27163.1 hypothetical protein [Microvirga arsenatis]
MDYHLERGLRLNLNPKNKPLYNWAINEIDAQGQQIGHDQIPWPWTLHFTATSSVLADSIDLKSGPKIWESTPTAREIEQRQVIRLQLRPGSLRDNGDFLRETTFSMFGTDRAIKSFQLNIHPTDDPSKEEGCTAWGTVSYTAEVDLRNETEEDCVIFYLYVKPETFTRYAAKISFGSVDEIIFSVGSVDGFYSEWSPSISTRRVKVLTKGEEHEINLPPGLQLEPPRLGEVGEARLEIIRRLEFANPARDPQSAEETVEVGTVLVSPETRAPGEADPRTLKMLRSLKRTAWFVVVLLALIFITTLLKS